MRLRIGLVLSVYIVVAVFGTQVPLLNSFGFEFAFVFALLATLVAGPLTVALVRPAYRTSGTGLSAFRRALAVNLLLLLAPLLVMAVHALFGRICSAAEGIGFFILIPAVTVVFASALAYLCAVHYRHAIPVYFLVVAGTLVYAAFLGYFTPAIFSYNVFYGFFPGLTYDELLPLTWTLVLYRLLTLGVALILVRMAVVMEANTHPEDKFWQKGTALVRLLTAQPRLPWTLGVLMLLLLVYWFRCELGFEATARSLQRSLGKVYTTDHFAIYYSPETYNDDQIVRIAREHEFRLAQIAEVFSLSTIEPIESYIYPSNEAKQRLIGAGNTNIAKPWSRQIHISARSLEGTLKHELVHVVAGRFGQRIIRANLSTGLVEGLAMAVEGNRGERTFHQYAAAMRREGIAPDITTLMTLRGFAVQSSSVSYVLAGSFCRYLIDRYGIRRIAQVYGSGDYETVYGRSLSDLVSEWNTFLDRFEVAAAERIAVDAVFRRPGIFGKACPRLVARRNREASAAFDRREFASAAELFRGIYEETGAYESLTGYLASCHHLQRFDSITTLYRSRLATDERPNRFLFLAGIVGDALWATGDTVSALTLYRTAAAADLAPGLTEQTLLREAAMRSTEAMAFRGYLTASLDDSQRVVCSGQLVERIPGNPVAAFLHGRALQRVERFSDALTVFRGLDGRGLDPKLRALLLMAEGYSLFRIGRYQEAKIPFWESLNHVDTQARQEQIEEWAAYCDWLTAKRR